MIYVWHLKKNYYFAKIIDHVKVIHFVFYPLSETVMKCYLFFCHLKYQTLKCISPLLTVLRQKDKKNGLIFLFLSKLVKRKNHILYTKYFNTVFTKILFIKY